MPIRITEQMVVGAIAGVTPLLINVATVDAGIIFSQFTFLVLLGYLFKGGVLMFFGALLVYVNAETTNHKAFQIGIMAPAIIIGFLNGQDINSTKKDLAIAQKQLREFAQQNRQATPNALNAAGKPQMGARTFSLISDANAGTRGLHHPPPESSSLDQFLYGFRGSPSNNWFVIAGSHLTLESAQAQAEALRKIGYDARPYLPFGDSKYFAVMIGTYLNLDEAIMVRDQALRDGLPPDIYLWKLQP